MKWATRNPLFFLSRKLDKRAGSKQCVVPFLSKNRAKRNMYLKQNNTKKNTFCLFFKRKCGKKRCICSFSQRKHDGAEGCNRFKLCIMSVYCLFFYLLVVYYDNYYC